jgi:CRP/FNR family transcriptional regulator, anaerobic regulatory protein
MTHKSFQILQEKLMTYAQLNEDEWKYYYEPYIEPVSYERKTFLTQIGEVENYVYWITEGVVRIYFIDNQREICIDFGFENNLVCSYLSFITRQPSDLNIQVIAPVKAYRIQHQYIQNLLNISQKHERFIRTITEQLYIQKANRERHLLSRSAEENYQDLIQKHPNIVQYLPVKDIASYLGIHPESLSRIRKRIL